MPPGKVFTYPYISSVAYLVFILKHVLDVLGKCPIERKQRPDMILAVDWDVKLQFNQRQLAIRSDAPCDLPKPTLPTGTAADNLE